MDTLFYASHVLFLLELLVLMMHAGLKLKGVLAPSVKHAKSSGVLRKKDNESLMLSKISKTMLNVGIFLTALMAWLVITTVFDLGRIG
jgi:hypothetical protein